MCFQDSKSQAESDANVAEYRWVLSEMIQEPIQLGLQILDNASVRRRCLHKGI
jgi:hypothetical protein